MIKRLASLVLAIAMLLQILVPQTLIAKEEVKAPSDNLVTVGLISGDSYDSKLMLELNRLTAKSRKRRSADQGTSLFGYFGEDNEPKDEDKPKYHGEVKAKLTVNGLDGGEFPWNDIFGTEEVHLRFTQINDDSGAETGIERVLNINSAGEYLWTDGDDNPAELPLFNYKLEPLTYEVKLDEEVSDKVKLLTARITKTDNALPTFEKPDKNGRIKYHLTLELGLQQVASSKFVSEWHTAVTESNRPKLEATMTGSMDTGKSKTIDFKFPTNDNDKFIIRTNNRREQNKLLTQFLYKTPTVELKEISTAGLTFDAANKTVKDADHKYKYDFKYDVIKGGKLTMTELIPVTFDANGGKFDSLDANAEQKIAKEVEYDGTLTDKPANPTKVGKSFKGWATAANGTTPAAEDEYKNLKAAKTFYAIWSDEDIQADELVVAESNRISKRTQKYDNDFVPTFDDLKAKVKVKDDSGNFIPLPADVTFSIIGDKDKRTGNTPEYDKDSVDLKNFLYDKVKEKSTDEVSRTETVKAKLKYSDGTTREVEIPIKVLKNVYKGSDQGGRLPHIPKDYVKVTLDPTNKAKNYPKTYYYVNPKAKVEIDEPIIIGKDIEKPYRWTIPSEQDPSKADSYNFGDRFQFKKETTITAEYASGKVNVKYVDEADNEIDPKYHVAGEKYPTEETGVLGSTIPNPKNDQNRIQNAPKFKGYIFIGLNELKSGIYTDPAKYTIIYKYNKKVTTEDRSQSDGNIYIKVIFDANGGAFKTDPKEQKIVYINFNPNTQKTRVLTTFAEVRAELEEKYGLPSKDLAAFEEWQDKDSGGTKVNDTDEIKFPGWVNGNYTPEVFYAKYSGTGAKIAYLDLDGKTIDDKYKFISDEAGKDVDGNGNKLTTDKKYPNEKIGPNNQAIPSDVFTLANAPTFIGYKFNRIEINPKGSKYTLDKNATIKVYYEKHPDVIEKKDGAVKPDKYLEVTFKATDKATDETKKDQVFWVNPTKEVTIPVKAPTGKLYYTFKEWKFGEKADGAVYNPSVSMKFTKDKIITATYGKAENIIPYDPSLPDPLVRPEGYIRVTFKAEPGLKFTESKAYYVKKNATDAQGKPVTLKDLAKPKYTAEKGYVLKAWDPKDTTEIGDKDIVVTAKATKLGTVIPEFDGNGNPNKKPTGYVDIEFVVKTGDEAKGSIEGVTKYYVNPNEYVVFTKIPATKPNANYKFGAWSIDTTVPRVYKTDTTVEASFNEISDVKTTPNPGDATIKYEVEGPGGEIAQGATTYYVTPGKEVSLNPPKVNVKTGYKFLGWNPDTTKATKYTQDQELTVKGKFEKLPDVVDGSKEKPYNYVTLRFAEGEHGTITKGETVYYVNPEANPKVKLGDAKIKKPTVKAEIGWRQQIAENAWDKKDTLEIKTDTIVTAKYEKLEDVIEKTRNDDLEKPEGYITVKFSTEANGKIENTNKTEKVLFVNPKKAVVLDGYKPTVEANKGYEFARWDTSIKRAIQYKDNDVIKALYNDPGDISKTEVAGYIKVEFKQGDHGTLTGDTNLWIRPGKKIDLPTPTVKPNIGYKFDKWDKALTVTLAAGSKPYEVTAQYAERDNIIAQTKPDGSDRPDGYHTVTFKSDANGTISGTTVYYVKPGVDIDLTDKANAITKKANVGYTEVGGTWDPAIASKKYDDDATYTFKFKALDDVVEAKTGVTKPNGYVQVKVVPTDKATDKTEKTYYVNPNKEVTIPFTKPTGKDVPVDASNPKAFKWIFKNWTSDEVPFRTWDKNLDNGFTAKFTQETTIITANYEKSITDQGSVTADEIIVSESFKDGSGTWVNNFLPKEINLKNALKVNGNELPSDATVTFLLGKDSSGTQYANLEAELYDKLQEKVNANMEPTRVEHVKAQVKFANGEVQNVDIPIKVYKNIYEAKTNEGKPSYVPGNYVKVTLDPTTKATKPQKYFYYVNPDAKVVIPGTDPTGVDNYKFTKWTMKADNATGDGADYTLTERHKFDNASTITAQYVSDVIPANPDGSKPAEAPTNFVSVTFKPTDNATDKTDKIYWVNPDKEVTIPVEKPVGKDGFTFKEWKIGNDVYNPAVKMQFKNNTEVKATYDKANNIIPYDPNSTITRPEGYIRVKFEADKGLELENVKYYYVKQNAVDAQNNPLTLKSIRDDLSLGYPGYRAATGYVFEKWDKEDSTKIGTEDIVVTAKATENKNVIEKKPGVTKPEGYVEVKFVAGANGQLKDGASVINEKVFYVNPKKYVTITNLPEPSGNQGYEFGAWDKDARIPTVYDKDTIITASFNEAGKVTPDPNQKEAGDVTVTFKIEGNGGSIVANQTFVYYVKPNQDVSLNPPQTLAETGYKFAGWTPDTTVKTQYTANKDVIGKFTKLKDIIDGNEAKPDGYVTVTFVKGENGKSITGQTVYYVNPSAGKTLGDAEIKKPTVVADTGYIQKTIVEAGVNKPQWDTADSAEIKGPDDITVKPVYEELKDVVPQVNADGSKNAKPKGYITVTFSTEDNGKVKDTNNTKTKVLYLNPDKALKLEDFAPAVTPITGYDFAGWDTQIDKRIQYEDNYTIKAKYNAKGDVIAQEKTDGSDKPAGYLTVTFAQGDHGTLSGKTVYYVNPNKEVTVTAPDVKPAVGYEFEKWDKALTQTFTQDTTITAQYKERENIIAQKKADGSDKPDGYHTVTFVSDANGTLSGTLVYYVKPGVDIDLTGTAKAITKNPKVGYTADGGTWSPAITSKKFTSDETYTFTFKALDDAIKEQTGVDKPDGYKKVTLKPTANAKNATDIVYYVNPTKEVTITNKPEGKTETKDGVEYTYTFRGWTVTRGVINSWSDENIKGKFTQDTEITAIYSKEAKTKEPPKYDPKDVIPFDPSDLDDPSKTFIRPSKDYIKITFKAEPGLKLTESKAYYVKKNAKAKDDPTKALTVEAFNKPKYINADGYQFNGWENGNAVIGDSDIIVTAKAKKIDQDCKPDTRPDYRPEYETRYKYRDRIIEKEKIVEKIVKVGSDDMLKEIRYMQGFEGKFRPYDGLRRCEAAQILANALKADGYRYNEHYALSYTDVGNEWYTDAIRVVTQAGVFTGYNDGSFKPQGKITRAEWVSTLRRFQNLRVEAGNLMNLRAGHWASGEVGAALKAGWLEIYVNGIASFDADAPITRQEVAAVSNKAFRRVLDKVYLRRSVNTLLNYKDINPSMPLYEDILCASNTLLTDGRYYKANTIVMDNVTFNIVTDLLKIEQKKFQYNGLR